MTTDIQRALDKQAMLEAEATPAPWWSNSVEVESSHVKIASCLSGYADDPDRVTPNTDLIAHLRNQARLARAVIETADRLARAVAEGRPCANKVSFCLNAIQAWADHVNGKKP